MFKDKAQFYKLDYQGRLPANNISQQLYFKQLPQCNYNDPAHSPSCCTTGSKVQSYYQKTPQNLWKDVRGVVGTNQCTDDAFAKQCFLSQYYNYLSENNTLS